MGRHGDEHPEENRDFTSKKEKREYAEKYLRGLAEAVEKGETPPSIVGGHTDPRSGEKSYELLGGNTRMLLHRYLGEESIPVKHVPLKGKKVSDEERLQVRVVTRTVRQDPWGRCGHFE